MRRNTIERSIKAVTSYLLISNKKVLAGDYNTRIAYPTNPAYGDISSQMIISPGGFIYNDPRAEHILKDLEEAEEKYKDSTEDILKHKRIPRDAKLFKLEEETMVFFCKKIF